MKRLFGWAAVLLMGLCPALYAGDSDLKDVQALLQLAPSRNMGSPYRQAVDEYVAGKFKATGFECGQIVFPTAAFVPGRGELRLADGTILPLHCMAPNTANPGNLPGGKWSGNLADLGNGSPEALQSANPMNAAALLDMESRRAWVTALELGAQVLIFVGEERDNSRQAAQKLYLAPLSVPRFYLSAADGARLRGALAGQGAPVTLVQTQPNRWESIQAVNDWVIIPGGKEAGKFVHIQAYKDAASVVPESSPGAESACNLALLLRLLDHYTKNKPQCTLIFSAVSDHCNYLRGEQFFLASAHPLAKPFAAELAQLNRELREAEFYSAVYGDTTPGQIGRLRAESSMETGQALFYKTPLLRDLTYQNNKTLHEIAELAERARRPGEDAPALGEQIKSLRKHNADLEEMMAILQKWRSSKTFELLPERLQAEFVAQMKSQQTDFSRKADELNAVLGQLEENGALARRLGGKKPLLYLTLDLTFGGDRMGFFFQGGETRRDVGAGALSSDRLATLAVNLAKGVPGGDDHFADTICNTGGVDWRYHLGDTFPMAAVVGGQLAIPALTLSTTADTRELHFTPSDTFANLNVARAARMMSFAESFLAALLEHPAFPASTRQPRARNYQALTFRYNLRRMDPFSVEIPTEPVRNGVVVAHPTMVTATLLSPVVGQVALYQVAATDALGAALFRAALFPKVEAYGFAPDFSAITRAIDAGAGARRVFPGLRYPGYNWAWDNHVALLFDAVQTDLVGLNNPSTRERVDKITVLDGQRESSPDHYNVAGLLEERAWHWHFPVVGDEGIGCIFTEPGMRLKVISPFFLLINATPENPTGDGFAPGDPGLRTITHTSARDMQILNGAWLNRIEGKGVKNAAATELYRRAEGLLKTAEDARAAARPSLFLGKSIEALSSAARSHALVRTTIADLIKAVAFFLALVIPFCMFLARLITPWTDIRAQIGVFLALFGVMAGGLALLHPAFSLSQTPIMVLLAFAMVGLAVFVMFILHARFESGLQKLVEESQGMESSQGSRKMLAGMAFSVGVNNMRRRRIRTTLTAVTIVLVTFTMLSVISVGQSLSPYRRKTQSQAPYNGVLFARGGMGPIGDSTVDNVVTLFSPYGKVVRRSWTQRLDSFGGYLRLTLADPADRSRELGLKSVLGVEVAENGLTGPMRIVAGRWFSSNRAQEIILSAKAASFLGVPVEGFAERELELRGHRVRLVGLLDDPALAGMGDLAGLPLLPLESVPNPVTQETSETGEMTISQEEATRSPAPSPRALSPQDCALLPVDFALQLPDTSVRSIAVKTPDAASCWRAANHFANATGLLSYLGLDAPVAADDSTQLAAAQYSLGSPVGASIGGTGKVVIPICLAATIILNTMLGSVMERKKEIAIYNAIGLNPTHVFVFFVAEAVVFGLIGSVAGYLIGQGIAQAVVKFNLLPGVNLNYSSMAVMVVVFAAMGTVVVSTLYPAYVATRAAVPSGQRTWKLPPPKGDEVHLDFPFSYTEDQLPGVLAFLHAFMDLNSEASSGQFLAQDARFGFVHDAEGRRVLALTYSITPVPFDLGVNQQMEIYGYYEPRVRACVVTTILTRVKGDRSSWLTVNQPFLESLRARLLSWRSQSKANQERFHARGDALFAQAAELPTQEAGDR